VALAKSVRSTTTSCFASPFAAKGAPATTAYAIGTFAASKAVTSTS
jgi:hypothetical protein